MLRCIQTLQENQQKMGFFEKTSGENKENVAIWQEKPLKTSKF